jgi:hypothetical protein
MQAYHAAELHSTVESLLAVPFSVLHCPHNRSQLTIYTVPGSLSCSQ